MAIVVVGGQSRNVGKTSVVAGLIRTMPERRWTAVKISQHPHGLEAGRGFEVIEERGSGSEGAGAINDENGNDRSRSPSGMTNTNAGMINRDITSDSARYLAAGAVRSLWVRTTPGGLEEAMPVIRTELAVAEHAIVESNSIVGLLEPDLFLMVLDPEVADFKPSSLRMLESCDAIVVPRRGASKGIWPSEVVKRVARGPVFYVDKVTYVSTGLITFVSKQVK
jgi:hypothetical protein